MLRPAVPAVVLVTVITASCSHDTAHTSPSTAKVTVTKGTAAAIPDVHLQVAPKDLHAETSWGSPSSTLQWPSLSGSPALSHAIEKTVEGWRKDFTADASGEHAALHAAWEPVANARGILGVRLTNQTAGADTADVSVALYGDHDHTWSSLDLIEPGSRQALVDSLRRSAAEVSHASVDDTATAEDVFTDTSFDTSGDLLLRIADGTLAPMSAGILTARIPNPEAHLSDAGRRVRSAAMNTPRLTPPSTSAPSASKATTDCTKAKCIALTFDDGPGPYTESILDTLEKKNAKASFFMLGPAAQAAPGTVRRMAKLGMGIGDHSWSHPQFTHLSKDKVTSEITRTADVIKKILGTPPFAVRPPYGDHDKATPHAGYPFVLWDVDTEDWKNRSVQVTTKRALDGAHRGAIVLMHDIHPTTAKALPGLIDALRKQGYTFVTVEDIAPHMTKDHDYSSGDVKK